MDAADAIAAPETSVEFQQEGAVATPVSPEQPLPGDAATVEGLPSEAPPDDEQALPEDESVIVVEAAGNHPPGDPMAAINEQTYEAVQKVDQVLVEPIAVAYEEGLPEPVRDGLSNFFNNLREPIVFLNFLLQGKPGKAFETLGRFAINTTIGIGGLFDVAKEKPFNLPYRNNGFANTLGFYGVDPGAFLYLPLVGPTTLRDAIGNGLDALFLPVAIGKPFNTPYYAVSTYTVRSFDERIELEEQHAIIRESASPYDLMREIYLCERQAAINELKDREVEDCADTFGLTMPEKAAAPAPADDTDALLDTPEPPMDEATALPQPELAPETVNTLLCPEEQEPLFAGPEHALVVERQCGPAPGR